ncbi:MAG: XdhC family protein [Actinomycetota bacterium]
MERAGVNLSETSDVLAAISSLSAQGRDMALATIVEVKGSTYRRAGARLLVPDAGEAVGNLSGGCLEGDVEAVAREVMTQGRARLEFYDLTAEDEVVWGWGLGCNGAIEVFIEPAAQAAEIAAALRSAIEEQRPVTVVTVLETSIPGLERGARLLLGEDGARSGGIGNRELEDALLSALADVGGLSGARTHPLMLPAGDARVFVESIEPPPRLLVCGAGHDAVPLVHLGAQLGWRVVVADDRDALLTNHRFGPDASFLRCAPGDLARAASVDARTYAVVMSHNYLRDRDYLRVLLGSAAAYIGMLGPQARLERLLGEMRTEGRELGDEELARIHGPAGLDVGAEGPEEIAAAIVAEVLAVGRGRSAGFLRDRPGPIHRREPLAAT